jgi:rubrerythrin
MKILNANAFKDRALRAYGFEAGKSDDFSRGKASAFWEVSKWADSDAQIYDDFGRFRVKKPEERGDSTTTFALEPDRTNHYHCEKCGYVTGIIARMHKFCPECGRKVKWDA